MLKLQFFLYDEPVTPAHGLMVTDVIDQLKKFEPGRQIVDAEWEIDKAHNRKILLLTIR